ncbi:MAG: hypothetical protein FIA82_01680 [Melioribacter sp.]|nr:hypothetical protein [Melioribacter sp.]
MTKKIDRRSFFSTFGKGAIITAVVSALPTKFISSIDRVSKKEKINIVIHPSAVKRTKKV